jgi:hypothetical protein
VVPESIRHIFKPFDISLLESLYCFTQEYDNNYLPAGAEIIDIESGYAFFLELVYWKNEHKPLAVKANLPLLSEDVVKDMSKYFIQVYTALWGSPSPQLLDAGECYLLIGRAILITCL